MATFKHISSKNADYAPDGTQPPKGVVVIAHGLGGGGQNTYMDLADYFTSNGYLVFAYDVTGNDKSEGSSVKGLPQGVIDLDYALRYVKQSDVYAGLPIVLFGHSWGGYSVGNVLNCQPDVKAAVLAAGFDRSTELFEQQGASMVGSAIKPFMPYVALYERIKFGKYAAYSAIDGFANTDAKIMILHSKDDTMVLPENGYDKFYIQYGKDARFQFIEYENRGHGYLYYTEDAKKYKDQLNKDYEAYAAENGAADSDALKADYMIKHLDKQKCYELDEDLMQQILHFYDSCCGYESSRYNLAPCAGTVSTSTPSKTSFSPLQSSAAPCTASIPACPANCSTSLRQHESI